MRNFNLQPITLKGYLKFTAFFLTVFALAVLYIFLFLPRTTLTPEQHDRPIPILKAEPDKTTAMMEADDWDAVYFFCKFRHCKKIFNSCDIDPDTNVCEVAHNKTSKEKFL